MPNDTLFPVSVVGSWARPPWVVQALRKKQNGEISEEQFAEIADQAVLLAIKYQEDAGVDVISDGEMRRDNFYSFAVDKLNGMKLMKVSDLMDYMKDRASFEEVLRALDVPAFAIKSPLPSTGCRRASPWPLTRPTSLWTTPTGRPRSPSRGPTC